ncbi:MAG: 2,3-bisphosphoglycerate-independent phosphoglycerate mutase [Euryarchaeota archaeon]|nr:2,3-bisphosphoglycerate-independent phosphoglycerate mutase [Euryarchaeota archaeon]
MKILLVICDGMADRPVEAFKGMTPLEAAEVPNMDRLAREGQTGLMDVIAPGIVPGSDTAHLALLGYDPMVVYTGRGPFEAAGEGVEVRKGDVAFRCNFATVDAKMHVTDRRAGRISSDTDKLASALNGMKIEDIDIIFKQGVDHRAVLVLRGPGLSPWVSAVDPHHEGKVLVSRGLEPEDEKTARILNEFTKRSYEILNKHPVNIERVRVGKPPANIALARGPGSPPEVPSFTEQHNGLNGAAVVGISLVRGLCSLSGLEIIPVKGATGSTDTDLVAKAKAAKKALTTHDFVLLHFKAPDLYGHDGDARGKVAFIEKIDGALKKVLDGLSDTVVCITADHSTPCSLKDHASDPVPVLVWGTGLRHDSTECFNELEAASGGLGHIRGNELMQMLSGLAGRNPKFGA